jgi:ABC-type Fe3+/spermidine/putrescine transport system ATPase subunit
VAGKLNTDVCVAIRPEKMNLHKDSPDPPPVPDCRSGCNVAKGQIKEISYLGDASLYHVLLPNGRMLRVSRPNRSRYDQDQFGWGEAVWVSWAGSSPVVLGS